MGSCSTRGVMVSTLDARYRFTVRSASSFTHALAWGKIDAGK